MNDFEQLPRDGSQLRAVERGDGVEYVADLGPAADAAVDVVGDTAIVVAGGDQHEIVVPDGASEAFIRNGVLTISTEDTQ